MLWIILVALVILLIYLLLTSGEKIRARPDALEEFLRRGAEADTNWHEKGYAYWILTGGIDSPFIYLPNESEGDWVRQSSEEFSPPQPILLYELRPGTYGQILHPSPLLMFHKDLLAFLDGHSIEGVQRYEAVIRAPRSEEKNTDYFVVKIAATTPLRALEQTAGYPCLSVVEEDPLSVLVSSELRRLLEESSLSGFEFDDPLFA